MNHKFHERIYQHGINWCVDVPLEVTNKLISTKGYIRIKGTINNFSFTQTLVPVKNALYRLYVNAIMMKGGKTAVGEVAVFNIAQNFEKRVEEVAMPIKLQESLKESNLETQFNDLTPYRKKEIMKYLNKVKGIETFERNLNSLLSQLRNMERDVRIPKNK